MKNVLLIRFSAMGDVAMTIPIIYSAAQAYPNTHFTLLSRKAFEPMFGQAPTNVHFLGLNLHDYKGLTGLNRLYSELRARHFDAAGDLHSVLRTHYLMWRFHLDRVPTAKIDKGRAEKRKLVRSHCKKNAQLPTSFERYTQVFNQLGFTFALTFQSIFQSKTVDLSGINAITGAPGKGSQTWIGIAPFAKHKGKIYPATHMERVIEYCSHLPNCKVFLFGGGIEETPMLQAWENLFANTMSCAGELHMEQELMLMSQLDLMVSMDSANMHLASLVGTPVVSIWGATHPHAGFMGWKQTASNALQIDMPCRPCSVFGDKPCRRGDYACMQGIYPEAVIEKINEILNTTAPSATQIDGGTEKA